jgi:hypothetical protein
VAEVAARFEQLLHGDDGHWWASLRLGLVPPLPSSGAETPLGHPSEPSGERVSVTLEGRRPLRRSIGY